MPPYAISKTQSKPLLEIEGETFQIRTRHNTPNKDVDIVERNVPQDKLLDTIKDYMPQFRSIEVCCEQTGELVYQRYASLDMFESGCEHLDNPQKS